MNITEPLLILGAGGQGKVVADSASAAGAKDIFFADAQYTAADSIGSWPVTETASLVTLRTRFSQLHIAVGAGGVRERLAIEALSLGFTLATVVHPSATVSKHAAVGAGCYIGPQAAVNIATVLGRCVIINTSASVDHDCVLGDFVHIAPGAHLAGNVSVGTRSWVGLGAVVRGGIRIGADATVGAGAAVVKDVADGVTVVGVPAMPLRTRSGGTT